MEFIGGGDLASSFPPPPAVVSFGILEKLTKIRIETKTAGEKIVGGFFIGRNLAGGGSR